ncbi:pirin family protein [Ulvibacterium marinum]|uniref:pirin family protein n=1 Tax=Ulvibacterium marinum TaxID=2419782 RepID=UPI002494F17F|nr:pirin family protein [Ulvibacterium marinum]
MPFVLHTAESRGHANHGWLDSHHTFSFANYYDSDRMNFGVLRVLNDDVVSEARGFGTHPHNNMEIISIPLEGDLQHMDSMGNSAIIRQGDVQVMSAGSGIQHSEYNKNPDKPVKFLQIWMFPNKQNVEPRYDQISLKDIERKSVFYQILSPNKQDQGVWVHQDAWFHLGDFDSGSSETYTLKKKSNGVYIFVLDGEALINNQSLGKRDGYGIWEIDGFTIESKKRSKVLVMEVPMAL